MDLIKIVNELCRDNKMTMVFHRHFPLYPQTKTRSSKSLSPQSISLRRRQIKPFFRREMSNAKFPSRGKKPTQSPRFSSSTRTCLATEFHVRLRKMARCVCKTGFFLMSGCCCLLAGLTDSRYELRRKMFVR